MRWDVMRGVGHEVGGHERGGHEVGVNEVGGHEGGRSKTESEKVSGIG